MASKKLMEMLNKGIAREIQVSVQYMWQHVLATGISMHACAGVDLTNALEQAPHGGDVLEKFPVVGIIPGAGRSQTPSKP